MLISRHDLARLLAAATKVVEARNTIPILSTVRLIAGDGKLAATATDLDIEISGNVDAEGSLSVCIDARLLAGIVNKLAGDEVEITTSDNTATIKAGRSRFSLPTLPVDDFPTMAAGDWTAEFEADLSALFAPCQFAVSTEETRYYLNGIYLHVDGGKLVAVATDGHRLARNYGQEHGGGFDGIIIPRKTVGIIPKGALQVRLSATKIQFVSGDTVITSKLIDGTFPDYQRVIPTGNDKLVTFSVPDMVKAAGRVAVVANERDPAAKLEISAEEIALSVRGAGDAFDVVPCSLSEPDGPNAEPLTVGFNASYLGELLGVFPAGDVKMAMADGGSPVLFTSDSAPDLLTVLMPRRV